MKKSIFSALCLVLLATTTQSAWGAEVTLSNANIVSMGTGSTSYKTYTATIDGYSWGAYAIKNYHSKATKTYHFLQIKKYDSTNSIAHYIQLPTFAGAITSIKMTVSGTSQTMSGGGNTATLYFSSSNSTSATGTGVASGSGASSVTIDCSSLSLKTGYITASGAVRIWDITVTYETGSTGTTVYLGLFLAAFVAVRACVRRVEYLYATFHHIIMSKIDFRSVHFAKALFFLFSVHFFCLTKRNERKKSQDCGGCVAKNLSFRGRLNRTRCARTAI